MTDAAQIANVVARLNKSCRDVLLDRRGAMTVRAQTVAENKLSRLGLINLGPLGMDDYTSVGLAVRDALRGAGGVLSIRLTTSSRRRSVSLSLKSSATLEFHIIIIIIAEDAGRRR